MESGIVYCMTRNKVEEIAEFLIEKGVPALPYHAGLDRSVRLTNQRKFLRDDGLVMVATIAFGMGIDKPDIRFVAHLNVPKTLEGYYQETGRAGRDGEAADAWMIYSLADVVLLSRMIEGSQGDEQFKSIQHRRWKRCWATAKQHNAEDRSCWVILARNMAGSAPIAIPATAKWKPGMGPMRHNRRYRASSGQDSVSARHISLMSFWAKKLKGFADSATTG